MSWHPDPPQRQLLTEASPGCWAGRWEEPLRPFSLQVSIAVSSGRLSLGQTEQERPWRVGGKGRALMSREKGKTSPEWWASAPLGPQGCKTPHPNPRLEHAQRDGVPGQGY